VIALGLAALLIAAPPPAPARGLDGPYDAGNPFAQILKGDRAQSKVYEDARVIVIIPLSAASPGHVLVIPKKPVRNLLEMTPEDMAAALSAARKAALAQVKALGATGFKIVQNNGASAGQTVFHAHFHVIPSYDGVKLDLEGPRQTLTRDEMNAMGARLRAAWPQ
jgi:histidine triad (HIT) family protein